MLNSLPNAAGYVRGGGNVRNEFEDYIGQKTAEKKGVEFERNGSMLAQNDLGMSMIKKSMRGGAPSVSMNKPPTIRGGNRASVADQNSLMHS